MSPAAKQKPRSRESHLRVSLQTSSRLCGCVRSGALVTRHVTDQSPDDVLWIILVVFAAAVLDFDWSVRGKELCACVRHRFLLVVEASMLK